MRSNTVPSAWLMNDTPLDRGKSKLERLTDFAEALLAEIAKENEPVAWQGKSGHLVYDIKSLPPSTRHLAKPIYAFPPSTEQIENRVAEACAELCDSRYITENAAYEIRAGKWKDYLK